MATGILDDKSEHCIPFLLEWLQSHRAEFSRRQSQASGQGPSQPPPFFLGLNGVQGAGKTTLVSTLYNTLTASPHNLSVAVFSLDDLYLTHADQRALAAAHPSNPLIQHRGVPSTHDIALAQSLFSALSARERNIAIPSYDKGAFNGEGDRRPREQWTVVNRISSPPEASQIDSLERDGRNVDDDDTNNRTIDVVIFEGWSVGFTSLSDEEVAQKWRAARAALTSSSDTNSSSTEEKTTTTPPYTGQLAHHKLENLLFINAALREYDRAFTSRLDALIQIDAEDTGYVYAWREEQEAALRAKTGSGMTTDQVRRFVDGYYPCYELYTENLRRGLFLRASATGGDGDGALEKKEEGKGRQLRLVVGRDRKVTKVEVL